MQNNKITFTNQEGLELAAKLDLPNLQPPRAYAIFSHCFTCNKNLSAVKHISQALTNFGFGVLRFDFTGLGESEGDFADTSFSSNIRDLISAAKYLEKNMAAPKLIIGHSLGGAAALFAGGFIPSIEAVAIVGAPAHPAHVAHLFKDNLEEINTTGKAEVNIGGRPFSIKKKFIDDLEKQDLTSFLQSLNKPLLILHSPQDAVVEVSNASDIYKAAKHPKSFISLDGADHLLSDSKDSRYAGSVIAEWVKRYISLPDEEKTTPSPSSQQVVVTLGAVGFASTIQADKHLLIADEPTSVGGKNLGPAPTQLVLSGLGACTAMTLRMYAERKKWDLKGVVVTLEQSKPDELNKVIIERNVALEGELDETQKNRLIEIANKCPVHKLIVGNVEINTTVKK